MSKRGIAALICGLLASAAGGVVPATAQQRGTLELGAFASGNSWSNNLGMSDSRGGGLRVGTFIFPRLSAEFEGSMTNAGRSLGRGDINAVILAARFTAVPVVMGPVSLLLGAGVNHTDTKYFESFGVQGLLGAKLAFSDAVALRVDAMQTRLFHGDGKISGIHAGLSFYRNARGITSTVTRTEVRYVPTPAPAEIRDSVSADETARLRSFEARYLMLRDSLAMPEPATVIQSSQSAAMRTMQEMVFFKHDRSDLSDSAKVTLGEKVAVFNSNPAMRIIIVGFASQPGTVAYNLDLGLKRSEAARAYLISLGISSSRIEISTRGEGQLRVDGASAAEEAANRRNEFRLVVSDPILIPPGNK